ncbi:hypothetical protein INR49_016304 [Caranx melampygus]|nr:hypothetical protein INR49_016304 [Caranx melampygus]
MRPSYKRENSVDSVDSLDSRALRQNSEGCGSDAEAEQVFRMETSRSSVHQNKGYVPPPLLRRKQGREENGRGCASPLSRANQNQVRPERPVQVNPGWIWSKSLSDIPMVYPVRKFPSEDATRDVGQDTNATRGWKSSVAVKDSEAQWQDDLTKWKNRRRSTKSDLRRKSQDREHVINQMTNGAMTGFDTNNAQGGPKKRDQQSPRRHNPAPRPYSTSPPSKQLNSDLRPHTRALLARSYATETPFSPTATVSPQSSTNTQASLVGAMPASDGNILGEETHFASLASDGAGVTTPSLDFPFSSHTQVKAQGSSASLQPASELTQPEHVYPNQISTLVTTIQPNEGGKSTSTVTSYKEFSFCADSKAPASSNEEDLSLQNHKDESQRTSLDPAMEPGRGQQAPGVYKYLSRTGSWSGSWSGSASLPRGYRRSDGSSRLSSAITARPFGTKQSRGFSLPRLYNVDDNQGLLLNSEKEEAVSTKSLPRTAAAANLRGQYQASIRQKKANQAKLKGAEQKEEGKGASVSSQTNGYHHQPYTNAQILPQPYSNLQSHHNKSSTLPLTKVDHSDMRVSLALKPNSRPDFGFQTHWDSTGARIKSIQPGSPAELCQLCVDDEIVAVDGVAVSHMSYSQWKDTMTSALQSGSLTMDVRRYGNKDWSTSEGSHHNQLGQSRMTINLTAAAPILIGCPDHHANSSSASTETTVTKAAKLPGQADNVVQSKVVDGGLTDSHRTTTSKDYNKIIKKNQKRREEFFKQTGGSESAISDLQVPSISPSSSSWSWDREEDRRRQEKWQEEQERLLQEQYQRDQERLEAEWQRAQQDAMGGDLSRKTGMTNGGGSPASTQLHAHALSNKSIEEEKQTPDGDQPKQAASEPHSNAQGVDWPMESCGFAQLSPAHRAKSLSTPALAGPHKQLRGDQRKRKGQSVSKAEQDRQQILEEMKKRTQLLTDNSWIRQRSSSFYKEPVYVGVPMKRYESLDDLDALRQSPISTATFGYPRPHSAAAAYFSTSRNASSRYSTGAMLPQRNTSMDSAHHGSAWAAADISQELRLESRFESATRSPTVSSAISTSSTLMHPPYDQYAVLQITE